MKVEEDNFLKYVCQIFVISYSLLYLQMLIREEFDKINDVNTKFKVYLN